MGTFQVGPCRCTGHHRGHRLLGRRCILLRMADDYQAGRGRYELVHIGLWRCYTFQSLVLGLLRSQVLPRASASRLI